MNTSPTPRLRVLPALSLVLLLAGCPTPSTGQGPQGEPGATGPAGPQGVPGDRGVEGPVGPLGPQGVQGPIGPQGFQGPAGTVLVLDGGVVTGPAGASVSVTTEGPGTACPAGGLRVSQLSDGGVSYVCNGQPGLPGATGSVGPQGLPGAVGAAGPQGLPGAPGAAGAQGLPGATGAAGPQGVAGVAGAQGPQGTVGAAGPQGPMGAQGPMGPAGPAGPALLLDGGWLGVPDRTELAGFTSLAFSGNLDGIPGANAKCSAEYPGTFFCTETDFRQAESPLASGPSGAWVDQLRDNATGLRVSPRCDNSGGISWTFSGVSDNGYAVSTTGGISLATCDQVKPLACCRRGSRVSVRGITAATFTGDLGGIPGANAKCHAEYAGSFFCTETDYRQGESAIASGASGAWVDQLRDNATGLRVSPRCDNSGGVSWTFSGASDNGYSVSTTGGVSLAACNLVKPLLCCQFR